MKNQLFGWKFCVVQHGGLYFHQEYKQANFYTENHVFISLGGPSETKKSQFIYLWLKIGAFQPKFEEKCLFIDTRSHFTIISKKFDNPELDQGVSFDFINSLKNNSTKYPLIPDDSCEEIGNSKALLDTATAGRHHWCSALHIKDNLLHQSKLGRDVEFQNTQIVLFKSLRDVMQVGTLSAQLRLGSELVDWYRDATCIPYGHLLIYCRVDQRLL